MTAENNRSFKPWKPLIWLACSLLVIIGSSFFFIAQIEGSPVHFPPTPHIIPTVSTPTALPSPTPSPWPAPTLTPTPLFIDYFVDNSKGWLVGDSAGAGYNRTIDENGLTLSATNHKILIESLPGNNIYGDFILTTTFIFQQGDQHDSMGLYLRGDGNLDHDYRFDIYGNNTYALIKESLDSTNTPTTTYLITPSSSPSLKPIGQANTLTLLMKGSTLIIILNGVVTNSITDSDYTRGQVALFVRNGTTSNAVVSSFSNITIYPAPDAIPYMNTPTASSV